MVVSHGCSSWSLDVRSGTPGLLQENWLRDGTTSVFGRWLLAMNPVEAPSSKAQLKTRRALVIKNMCDLMKELGQADKFKSPDEWMDSIIERPRKGAAGLVPPAKPPQAPKRGR